METEHDIIQKAQRGDRQAFGIIVQKYMKHAYYIALGLVGSHEAAMDLSQEAFVRAYYSLKKFDPERKFFTWYYQILKNLSFNYLRDNHRQAASFSEIGEAMVSQFADSSNNLSQQVEQNELHELLWKGINALKPPDREIIILKDFQEMSYKEIAEILKCPVGTVMSRLYNARKALKELMEGYYHE
ncbi:sigma-70 family RNA polymerase sigma factor [candidate division KSB1 bacterium]|nr:sigma-70 family RNA polymerase sigma factor [candidate division KSB1 bacterium]